MKVGRSEWIAPVRGAPAGGRPCAAPHIDAGRPARTPPAARPMGHVERPLRARLVCASPCGARVRGAGGGRCELTQGLGTVIVSSGMARLLVPGPSRHDSFKPPRPSPGIQLPWSHGCPDTGVGSRCGPGEVRRTGWDVSAAQRSGIGGATDSSGTSIGSIGVSLAHGGFHARPRQRSARSPSRRRARAEHGTQGRAFATLCASVLESVVPRRSFARGGRSGGGVEPSPHPRVRVHTACNGYCPLLPPRLFLCTRPLGGSGSPIAAAIHERAALGPVRRSFRLHLLREPGTRDAKSHSTFRNPSR